MRKFFKISITLTVFLLGLKNGMTEEGFRGQSLESVENLVIRSHSGDLLERLGLDRNADDAAVARAGSELLDRLDPSHFYGEQAKATVERAQDRVRLAVNYLSVADRLSKYKLFRELGLNPPDLIYNDSPSQIVLSQERSLVPVGTEQVRPSAATAPKPQPSETPRSSQTPPKPKSAEAPPPSRPAGAARSTLNEETLEAIRRCALPDFYARLGVDPSANADEIKTAYRRLVQLLHTDRFEGHPQKPVVEEAFKRVNEAYETLKDVSLRAKYNDFRGSGARNPKSGQPPDERHLDEVARLIRQGLSGPPLTEAVENFRKRSGYSNVADFYFSIMLQTHAGSAQPRNFRTYLDNYDVVLSLCVDALNRPQNASARGADYVRRMAAERYFVLNATVLPKFRPNRRGRKFTCGSFGNRPSLWQLKSVRVAAGIIVLSTLIPKPKVSEEELEFSQREVSSLIEEPEEREKAIKDLEREQRRLKRRKSH